MAGSYSFTVAILFLPAAKEKTTAIGRVHSF
jgi:hypothetical protein